MEGSARTHFLFVVSIIATGGMQSYSTGLGKFFQLIKNHLDFSPLHLLGLTRLWPSPSNAQHRRFLDTPSPTPRWRMFLT